jgi:sphinganine-1-phosphate aldolase
VPGVTSISADLHKFAYAGKGASLLLWRAIDGMRHQIFVATDFPGGIYASPTLLGTRPGGPIAAAWAALHTLGDRGYLELARAASDAADRLRAGIHLTVTANHAAIVDDYLTDLAAAAGEVRRDPALVRGGTAPMYGMAGKLPIRRLVASRVRTMIAELYTRGGS